MRKSFVFYLSWREMIQSLTDEELRRFINNLISWHLDEEIELTTNSESAIWSLIEPALLINDKKWNSRAGTSRENGKLGGRPSKKKETQQVFEEPTKPVNSEEVIGNGEEVIGNGEEIIGNGEEVIVESKSINSNFGESLGNFHKRRIKELTGVLESEFSQYPFLVSMANPEGIKELRNHIEKKEELDRITLILKELSISKKELWGRYD
jgi:hypothetical protein